MNINNIFSKLIIIIACIVVFVSIYDFIKIRNSAIIPSELQIVKFCNYEVKLSEKNIEQFKEKINSDFFKNNNYQCYSNFKESILKLMNIIQKFNKEITNKNYLRTDDKIQGISVIFKDILDKITIKLRKGDIYLGNYHNKKLNALITNTYYKIFILSSYISYILKILVAVFICIIVIIIEHKFKKK